MTSTPKSTMRDRLERELVDRARDRLRDAATSSVPSPPQDDLAAIVLRLTASALRMVPTELDSAAPLAAYGIDSIAITEVMGQIARFLGVPIAPTVFFEASTLDELVGILRARHPAVVADRCSVMATPISAAKTSTDAAVPGWIARHRARRRPTPKPGASPDFEVAVIAMDGAFAGSPDVDALEAHLRNGDDCISEIPPGRWDWRAVDGDPRRGPYTTVRFGGFVPDADAFDAAFFGISPKEAELMDPQHRRFMQCVWRLIEAAGHAPRSLAGRRVGLFLGINLQDYADLANRGGAIEPLQLTGLGHAFCANRLSFLLDLQGPSQVIDTACSSSLVAIHRGAFAIRHEGCEMAIAGGANLMLTPNQHILFSRVGMLAPDGRCKAFGSAADGYGRADGVGAILLKRLDLAERDGDPILAVLRGSAENHGGGGSSLTAPNPASQARLLVDVYQQAGIDPRSLGLIECHGTGTKLGDPVEIEGLKTAFATLHAKRGLVPPPTPYCGIGSVKSTIGHAETAAGVAGVIKALLALRHAKRYRSLHCAPANPLIDLTGSPFFLLDAEHEWPSPAIDGAILPRRAGVSSFGAGGANAHVVLEEYRPAATAPRQSPGPQIVPLSARDDAALMRMVGGLADHLDRLPPPDLADLAYTLQVGRDPMRVRLAMVVDGIPALRRNLAAIRAGDRSGMHFGTARKDAVPASVDAGLPACAAAWVEGSSLELGRLHAGRQPRRLALPTYPFARTRFWLSGGPPAARPADAAPTLEPLGPDRWRVRLDPDAFYLRDHCVGGVPVLPGVMVIELMRKAAEAAGLSSALRQIVWLSPLQVQAPRDVELTLQRDGRRPLLLLEGLDPDGGRRLHAQAAIDPAAPAPEPGAVDLDAIEAALPNILPIEQLYGRCAAIGLEYGAAHRAVIALSHAAPHTVMARLRLPDGVPADGFVLHPSLTDGAFQAILGLAVGEADILGLPFALDRIDILRPCTSVMAVHIRAAGETAGQRTADLDLYDASGHLCVRMRGFATRRHAPPAMPEVDPPLLFIPEWRQVSGPSPALPPLEWRTILFCAVPGADMVQSLRQGWRCTASDHPADAYPAHAEALRALLLGAPPGPGLLQVVVPGPIQTALLAGLSGMLRSARHESPRLWTQLVALSNSASPAMLASRLDAAASLRHLAELDDTPDGWQSRSWQPLQTRPAPAPAPWRDGAVTLITGGLGGIGRLLAEVVVQRSRNAVLLLASRRPPDAAAAAWLASLTGVNGATVSHHVVDVADQDATRALVGDVLRRHGRLDVVLHAAGVTRDGPLTAKTAETLADVLAPKVAGTLSLDRAIGATPSELFVLFGSVTAAVGNAGQADYAAANGFLDGFAVQRETMRARGLRHGRTIAIDWPLWRDGGMRMTPAVERMMQTATGLSPLPTASALDALVRAIATTAPVVLVATGDLARIERFLNPPPPGPSATSMPDSRALHRAVLTALEQMVSAQLKVAPADLAPEIEFADYGFDSISFTLFANALNDRFGLALTPTVFFEHTTLERLAEHLAGVPDLAAAFGLVASPEPVRQPARYAPLAVPGAISAEAPVHPSPIAIIGLSGIFPGAPTPAALWQVLREATDCIGPMPEWRRAAAGASTLHGGFVDAIDRFDPGFFGLSVAEARIMDPQQRLLLTLAWRLFEDANIAPRSLWGAPVGVFVGIAETGYGRLIAASGGAVEAQAMTGLAPSVAPNRISFLFNLTGPSSAVETACSSALVAIHRAVAAIRAGECESAIAGGINALLLDDAFEGFTKAGMLAPDGRSKSFGAGANGYGRGEGGGLVLLKPLHDAERDGDRILALIRASVEGHGGRAASLTAPNPAAQADLLRRAYRQAGFDPRSVTYIEAHGTGTPLGDPIEVEALNAAFADLAREAETRFGPAPPMHCGIGSVKSNIGHLELAAGIAGVAKVLLQMRHGALAPSLHCATPNPLLPLGRGPFHLVREATPWTPAVDASGQAVPRRAGISSFGFGGSNAHLVLEDYVAPIRPVPASDGPCLIVLSARSENQLGAWATALRDALRDMPAELTAADIAYTLQVCRDAMEYRAAFLCRDRTGLEAGLDAIATGRLDGVRQGQVKPNREALALLDDDATVRAALAGLPARGRQDLLLDLWVRGFAFDWHTLYDGPRPRRVDLPGMPLSEGRYWVRAPVSPHVPSPSPAVRPDMPPPAAPTADLAACLTRLTAIAARRLEAAPADLDPDSGLGEFGFDSVGLTRFAAEVNEALNLSLTPADLFEFSTLNRLARHVVDRAGPLPAGAGAVPMPAEAWDPVAIVGMSCCLPGADDAEAFWRNLRDGVNAITEIPADRWDWRAIDGDPKRDPGRTDIRWGGFIDGVFAFDPLFFGISPREAHAMDPQQRLMLMHAWKAIEDAGHDPRSLAGRSVGVFVGTASSGYSGPAESDRAGYAATGTVPSVGPNRISYVLDLHGPSEPIETACSSSLVAVHRAVQAIAAGDCDMALAGGVNTMVTSEGHLRFSEAGMLSPDGRCSAFSADANGYVRGEGVGMLVLKRLSAARRDKDPVLAVIRGSAINHGGRANSLTAPNTEAQASVLRQAYAAAGVDVASVGYVEAHGTGTALGDPVELRALTSVFGAAPSPWCGIGSVKTGIGHLELAAGVAGIVKVVLQMRHRTLAPTLHADPPNPYIRLEGTPFFLVRTAQPWRPLKGAGGVDLPLRAGISSFGFGGVNAHVVLEEPPPPPAASDAHGPVLVVLSAHDPGRLQDLACRLLASIDSRTLGSADLHDLAYTLQLGRAALRERLALVAGSPAALREGLAAMLNGHAGAVLRGTAEFGRTPPPLSGTTDLAALAKHWVQGGAVDWAALHPSPRRRLRLPTYPFSKDPLRPDSVPSSHALPHAAPGAFVLDAADPMLRDHRVQGACIVPGAMILELARQVAGREGVPLSLCRVVWLRPAGIPASDDPGLVRVEQVAGGAEFCALESSGKPCAQGVFAEVDGSEAPLLDLAAIEARCLTDRPASWLYDTFAELGLQYGPAYRGVQSLRTGPGEALACLRLPDAAADPAGRFAMHPAMLDGAFQACLGLNDDSASGGTPVPFALDRLDILAPTTCRMWAHARLRPGAGSVRRMDIDLADEAGAIRIRVRGLAVRLLPATSAAPLPSVPDPRAAGTRYLAGLLSEAAQIPAVKIEPAAALEAYGIDSLLITRLTDRLEIDFGPLSKTLFFEHTTLAALADYFCAAYPARLAQVASLGDPVQPAVKPVQRSTAPARQDRSALPTHEPIAIIGVAGRYPGAPTLAAFWDNLAAGQDSVTEIPADRFDVAPWFSPVRGEPGKTNSKWGGFIDDVDRFDALFFNIASREADFMDPQERLFLQCAWETLEDAGYTRAALGDAAAGVFVGVMYSEYQLFGVERTAAGEPMALGASAASIANRVSYVCGLTGPSLAVDSMCSSSLTAIHLACESLRAGGCAMALAGGVNLTLHPNKYLMLAKGRFSASSGRCESFGRGGDGYVPGEGVGAVLLKPLSKALADGDRIHATIRGAALNHGGKTNGYTVPNPAAQTAVIVRALDAAGVAPHELGYVEAHGTGTILGDPIEVAGLSAALKRDRRFPPIAIGSVKSNIGHCESAAGIAGLTKVLLQMRHGMLAPSLHAETLNPAIDFEAAGLRVQRHLEPWSRQEGKARIAGLSSFGAGGSNAHLVIEEHVAETRAPSPVVPRIFPFSARDERALDAVVRRFLDAGVADVEAAAFVLQEGREAFEHRLAVVATGAQDLQSRLEGALAGQGQGRTYQRGRRRPGMLLDLSVKDLDAIAGQWVIGATVDWARLRCGAPPCRIGLPTYPFARERHWFARAAPAEPVPAPLLFRPVWQPRSASAELTPPDRRLVVWCADAIGASGIDSADIRVLAPSETDPAGRLSAYATAFADLLRPIIGAGGTTLVQLLVPVSDDAALPEALAGMLRSACQEQHRLRGQTVAIGALDHPLHAILEAERCSADTDIRYDGRQRVVRSWTECPSAQARSVWKDGGVYLITGGSGKLAHLLCADIARRAHRPVLILASRSELPQQARAALDGLDATVVHHRCDVTDAAAVAALVTAVCAAHGRLNGIVHTAGLIRDGALATKTNDDIRAVLAGKVAGAINLDAATADLDLDLMLLFASGAGPFGNAGQADYSTANAFLDAFAARRAAQVAQGRRRGLTLSVDWPYWREGGMPMPPSVVNTMEKATGLRPLETEPAMAALSAALAVAAQPGGPAQVLVLDGDHTRLRAAMVPRPDRRPAPDLPTSPGAMLDLVRTAAADALGVDPARIDANETFDRYGMDSVTALDLVERLARGVGPLPGTLALEHPTVAKLAAVLSASRPTSSRAPKAAAIAAPSADVNDIAVIAVAGRYPGADDIETFWDALREGRDLVAEVPPERWDHAAIFEPGKGRSGRTNCGWGGFLSDVDRFDAGFFGVSPQDAARMDPQERLFLETTWRLLEAAGQTRARLRAQYDGRVGVYAGAMYQQYQAFATDPDDRALLSLATHGALANRVSFFFDLQGPSVAVDAMCASGLQAVHLACRGLLQGECRLAIAGAVNLSLHPDKYLGLGRAGLLGSTKDSRSFAAGDGYLPAEGVGAVLLKPLADALNDGDPVLGVIKASASNHSGHSAGYGVPSLEGQARLIEENLRASGVDPRSIGYAEAAATGAPMADAIELRAAAQAFKAFTPDTGFCAIGSVKFNMGHAEAASGLAQLTKVLLQLRHRELVPSVRGDRLNPDLAFDGTAFRPQTGTETWRPHTIDGVAQPLRATVSAFGAGGSNVHLVVQEGPSAASAAPAAAGPRRFLVSARTDTQLQQVVVDLATWVRARPDVCLGQLASTLRDRRERMACVAAIIAESRDDLLVRLAAWPNLLAPPSGQIVEDTSSGSRPLDLPPYPLNRERHWLGAAPSESGCSKPATPASQDAETMILEVIAEETGHAAPPADANFHDLGATSMFGLRLIRVCADRLGVTLTHRDIEAHPSALALAAFLGRPSAPTPEAGAVPMPQPSDAPMPLSQGQEGLWSLQALLPETGAYNVPMAFEASGLDVGALDRACHALAARFPGLSSRFPTIDGVPWCLPAHPAALQLLSMPPGTAPNDYIRTRIKRPFDLAAGPPFRCELVRGGPNDIVLIVVHHIAIDGLSAMLVAQAFWALYEQFASGADLPPPRAAGAAYTDFVAWERDLLASPLGEAQRAYWARQLAAPLPVTELPTDAPPDPARVFEGRHIERMLPASLTLAARRTASQLRINPATLFLGVFQILLSRLCGVDDVIVGMPTLGRPESRFEASVGLFANVIAVRTRIEPHRSAAALLCNLQHRVTEGLDHAFYPYVALCRQLGTECQPLHQVGYAYTKAVDLPLSEPMRLADGARIVPLPNLRQDGDSLFALEISERRETTELAAVFNPSRLADATVERMLDQFTTLLAAVCADPDAAVATLDLLDSRQLSRVMAWGEGDPLPRRQGLPLDWICRIARQHPWSVALRCGETRLRYGAMVRRAGKLSAHLRASGAGPGNRVGVLLDRGPDSVVALLATLGSGAAWVPLDPGSPDARLALMTPEGGFAVLITDAAHAERARSLGRVGTVVRLDRDAAMIRSRVAAFAAVDPDSPAYIIHTSGSTGRPKGVVVSHAALAAHCLAVVECYGLTPADRVLQFAQHDVDTALEQIVPTLVCGASLVMRGEAPWSAADLARTVAIHRVTVADLPPAYLDVVLKAWAADDTRPPAPRLVLAGGEAMPQGLVRLWRDSPWAGTTLLNAYGPTEATITACVHPVETSSPDASIPIGRPLPGVILRILDHAGRPAPEGTPGELYIGGRLALGYDARPELTRSSFVDDPMGPPGARLYRTGDRAVFLPGRDGVVGFLGRLDRQVQIRGFRVEPGDVEAALAASGALSCAVTPRPGPDGGTSLVAFVAAPPGFDTAALASKVARRLPPAARPTRIVRLDTLPLTPAGKIDRQALARRDIDEPRALEIAALEPIEAQLLGLWRDVLGPAARFGVDDDFFVVGGHSLAAVRLAAAVQKAFGRRLTIGQLIEAPTIAQQAHLLSGSALAAASSAGTVLRLRPGGTIPLFCLHPAGGTAACYLPLARALGPDVALYGVQSPGIDADSVQPMDLSTLAAHHVAAIRHIKAAGPYNLLGWSVGGTIAFEVARQLQAQGQTVARLLLLDAYAPAALSTLAAAEPAAPAPTLTSFAHDLAEAAGRDPAVVFADGELPDRVEALLEHSGLSDALAGFDAVRLRRSYDVFAATLDAVRTYRPTPLHLPATLFRAEDGAGSAKHGWRGLIEGGLLVRTTPGRHSTMLLPPHVGLLARQIDAALSPRGARWSSIVRRWSAGLRPGRR